MSHELKPPIQVAKVGTQYGVLINGNVSRTFATVNEAVAYAAEQRKADNSL